MKSNFKNCMEFLKLDEGGVSDRPPSDDRGGATYYGITLESFGGTREELFSLTQVEIDNFYKEKYWDVIRGDELSRGIDYAVFDASVNSGTTRAIKWLQNAVGAVEDGMLGPQTFEAVKNTSAVETIRKLCRKRAYFLLSINGHYEEVNERGWLHRVVDVTARAVQMALLTYREPQLTIESQKESPNVG